MAVARKKTATVNAGAAADEALQAKWEERNLRREALGYALNTPDWIVSANGILKVASSYYAFLKGDVQSLPEDQTGTTAPR
jgi:hypothetical protein